MLVIRHYGGGVVSMPQYNYPSYSGYGLSKSNKKNFYWECIVVEKMGVST